MSNRIKNSTTSNVALYFALTVGLAWGIYWLFASNGILGNDFWWHIKVGEWIVENKTVPTTDIFSWYGQSLDIPWTAHEWLSDVIYYVIYSATGEIGIFTLSIFAAISMIYLLWRAAKQYISRNVALSILFFLGAAISANNFYYARPHLISFFLLYALVWCLYRFHDDEESKSIYFIPLIACVWSNVHGGSSNMTYIVCAIFTIVGTVGLDIGCIHADRMSKKASIKMVVTTIASALAILINPIGLKVLVYPYKSFADTVMISSISEWQSPDAKSMTHLLLYFVPIVLMLIGFFAEKKKIRMIDLAMMGFFTFLFLRSVRFIALWYIVAPFCAFRYMPELKMPTVPKKTERMLVVCVSAAVITFVICGSMNVRETIQNDKLIKKVVSQDVIDVVKQDSPERLFNDYNLGETLIYNDIETFFDARADLFIYDNIMADGVSLQNLTQKDPEATDISFDPEALIKEYDFDAFIILRNRALYSYLITRPDRYELVYENETAAYFRVIEKEVISND